ncbi:MAG: hypothetical protein ACW97Z_08655 [Candidatus Hodarchaeales archaeon]
MEVTSEYSSKVVCDGPCHVCKHSREKDVNTQAEDIIYYCRNCQEKYLCTDVLGRDKQSSEFLCPKCNSSMSEITVDRAHQLGLAFGFHYSRLSPNVRPVDQIRRSWFYSPQREVISKDFVNDLINYELLDTPQLLDLLFHSDLPPKPSDWVRDKKALLWEIFAQKPQIIKSIHNSLITQSENRKGDLIIRALVNYRTFGCAYLSVIIPPPVAGTVDLVGIDEKTGGLVWIVVQENLIDEKLIGTILNEILSIPPLEFMGVERILVLTQKWIWMASQIALRQGRIATRWHQLQLETWEEDPIAGHNKI